jgi:hypothetical protein
VVAVGLLCARVSWEWAGVVAFVILTGLCAAAVVATFSPSLGTRGLLRAALDGVVVGLVCTGGAGLVAVLGGVGAWIVLVLAVTSPALATAVRLRPRRRGLPGLTPGEAPAGASDPRDAPGRLVVPPPCSAESIARLDDAALCRAWRRSFLMLEPAQSLEDRMIVVRHRQHCLDELNRRCPRGVEAWLASGARASSDPLPFLDDAG